MPIITINLPVIYVKNIQALIDAGLYKSRSDFLRKAIHEYILEETLNSIDLDPTNFEYMCVMKKKGRIPSD